MKTISALITICALGLLSAIAAQPASELSQAEFPYVLLVELGATEFAPEDAIVITSLRGNRKHLEPGGRYLLEGRYTLASADTADLAWFATSRKPSGSTAVSEDEHIAVKKGSGTFSLRKTLTDDGWLHVSFYADGRPHGGIYFGEAGADQTVLRTKTWSDLSSKPGSANPPSKPISPANAAILAYLGEAVPTPPNLDAQYTPAKLASAFTDLTKKAGLRLQKLVVDDSEFPFLLYGLIGGKHDYHELEKHIRATRGYDYAGSVVGTTDDTTFFSINIIPADAYPRDLASACHRRLMVRLQVLADAMQKSP